MNREQIHNFYTYICLDDTSNLFDFFSIIRIVLLSFPVLRKKYASHTNREINTCLRRFMCIIIYQQSPDELNPINIYNNKTYVNPGMKISNVSLR